MKRVFEGTDTAPSKGFGRGQNYDEKWMPIGLPREINERESVFENLDVKSKLLLDLGAGTLRFSLEGVEKGAKQVLAVDTLRDMLAWGMEKANSIGAKGKVDVVVADVRRLPLRDNIFDVAIAIEVFEHIPTNAGLFVREIYRVLKKSGKAGINTWNAIPMILMNLLRMSREEVQSWRGHFYYRYYYPWEFNSLIRAANFSQTKVLGVNNTYFLPRLGKIAIDRLFRKFRPFNQVTGQFLLAILLK